jgi:rhodanese-related sulfurtransferase
MNIPLGELAARLESLAKDRECVFVCARGNRSVSACRLALRAGHASVASLEGGMQAWDALSGPRAPGPDNR